MALANIQKKLNTMKSMHESSQLAMLQPLEVREHWQYTENDWFHDNSDMLYAMHEDLCDKIRVTGAQIDIGTFDKFVDLVFQITWIPQIGREAKKQ
jgi:hypothetical protein